MTSTRAQSVYDWTTEDTSCLSVCRSPPPSPRGTPPSAIFNWKRLAILNGNWSRGVYTHQSGPLGVYRDVRAVLLVPGFVVASVRELSHWSLVVFRRGSPGEA